jgi:3-deoxy-manno-octulosonate cytidylyltransferase (CMP-KDO synthetase)
MQATAIIPARFGSTRFPGKPLANKTGKPLIQHVVEQIQKAQMVIRIVVATDDQRIHDAVLSFGGEAVMTREDHPNGTSRLAEAVQLLEASSPTPQTPGGPGGPGANIILNVQGDEPEIEPAVIDQLVQGLANDPDAPMATLASPFADDEDPTDPNIVKLVVDQLGRALYFSRSLIPCHRDAATSSITNQQPQVHEAKSQILKHPGVYAYRRDFLLKYVTLPPTPLEEAEKLEQLRALEHGYKIAVVQTVVRHHGIDTPEQYEAFVKRQRDR